MFVSEEKINEIRRSVNIVDIISEYIPIEQRGRNYFSICPFHDDHNPSMSISPEKQIYTCFVCGAHGNVFNFIMDYENVSFFEALKIVANKAGIHLDVPDNKAIKKDVKIESMYDVYDIANKFYQNNLLTKEGELAKKYLYDRGFTDEVIKEFGVGLSTKNSITKLLKAKKIDEDLIIKSGISSKKNEQVYDTFSERIMFPLWDLEGKCVGFSGRIYNKNDSSKYVNSKESDIFKKGKLLYNYHKAKEEARRKKSLIVVEGFMDVIALYMVGIKNVVATMGTAITPEQAKLLKKLSTNIILCFDGDDAGNKATLSCSKELNEIFVTPKIVRLPDKLDPDEYIKKYGVDKFIEYIDSPLSFLDYKINYYRSNTNFNNMDEISKYIKEVTEELKYVEDKIVKELTIKKISDETNVSIETIKGMIKGKVEKEKKVEKKEKVNLNKYEKAERRLIFYMLRYPEVIKIYEKNKCYFPTDTFRYLVSEIVYYNNKHESLCIADFISYLNDKKELLSALNEIDTMDINENYSYEEIMDYINLINDYSIREQIKRLTNEFKMETDITRKTEIAKEISELKVSV